MKTLIALSVGVASVIVVVVSVFNPPESPPRDPRLHQNGGVISWWDPVPPAIQEASVKVGPNRGVEGQGEDEEDGEGPHSNIVRADYVGPEACVKCHPKQHQAWSKHPHRWMNAVATTESVLGDFQGVSIQYLGGKATFSEHDGQYRMSLERDGVSRVYQITQTIGSRFYQYYVGRLLEGPEPAGDRSYEMDHVLPFGYWLDRKEWVPTVHVHWANLNGAQVDEEDLPSAKRHDPFAAPHQGFSFTGYYQCNQCHTTMPLGDLLVRNANVIGRHAPLALHFDAGKYLQEHHPELPKLSEPALAADGTPLPDSDNLSEVLKEVALWDARQQAVTLGVSCEACHLGAKQHAEGLLKRPRFFPDGAHLFAYSDNPLNEVDSGRTHANLNWACGRCHTGGRRLLAGGMATWNSTEYTDAMRGSCYSQLQCVDCHDPHEATGKRWTKSATADDASCMKCHDKFESPESLAAHTHHDPKSEGSRCMNCHMPRLNEGLQDVVRTHMIFSPTNSKMIEANQPNACNMCHVEKPIDWTLSYLQAWYGKGFNQEQISKNYADRNGPTALGWAAHQDQSVRLIGVDVLGRRDAHWALPQMIDALDDPFIINRQFARVSIEKMLGIELSAYGYTHYMTSEERQAPLAAIRPALAKLVGP